MYSSTVEVIELTTASVEPSFVLCGAVSVSGRHVAVGMDNKTLAMWKKEGGAGWTRVGVRWVNIAKVVSIEWSLLL